jgi:hypothetical protein
MERRFNMFALTKLSTVAAVGALVVLGGYGLPARADELAQNLGPVGPHQPILTTFGNKRVIAFYEPDQGRCFVNAVVWDTSDLATGMTTASRVRVNLDPREIIHLDSTDNKTITLQCGDFAETLKIVDGQLMTAGAAR